MNSDRTGQIWAYSSGVFLVTGASTSTRSHPGSLTEWMDHPIVWLDDPLTIGRAEHLDGFIEYVSESWETLVHMRRIA